MSQLKIVQSARYIVGVDPDLTRSGVAIFDNETCQFIALDVKTMAQFQMLLFSKCPVKDTHVVVEAAWLWGDKLYFQYQKALPKSFGQWRESSRYGYMFSRGTDVGRNFGVGETICAILRESGYSVEERKPASGKWDAATFKHETGEPKGHNEEIRDAVRIIYPLIQYQLNIKKSRQQAQPQTATTNGKAKKGRGANARTKS